MSHEAPTRRAKHGTITSYSIGFILSLILTLIPYYLVQRYESNSKVLLLAILEFAFLQLIIQVVYFLHLGRKPQPRWELYFFVATLSMVLVVVGGSLIIVNNLHRNMSTADQQTKLINDEAIYQINGELTGACQTTHTNHQVIIKNNQVSPRHTITYKCDTLTFVNNDSQTHAITFGTHPAHSSYAGESELDVRPGKTKTITLSEIGGYNFHDHLRPDVAGSFLVLNSL